MSSKGSKHSKEHSGHEPTDQPGDAERRGPTATRAPDYDGSDAASVNSSEQERRDIVAMEKRLPRPDWYTSDDEDSDASSFAELETTDMMKPQEGGLITLIVYTALCFVAFVFTLTSTCPIPWMRGKGANKGRQYGVWRAKKGGQPDFTVRSIHDCSIEQELWRVASAFSVMATFMCFGALVSGIFMCVGRGHIGASMILSFYGTIFSLVAWSVVAALFNNPRCNKGKLSSIAHLDAGFALTLIAFVFMLASIFVMAMQFFTYYTKSIHAGVIAPMRFIYVGIICVALLFGSVGPAYTQWSKSFPDFKCKVTIWRIELHDKETKLSSYLGRKEYKCTTFTRRMKVVAAFIIMSDIWLALSILVGLGACFQANLTYGSNWLGWAGAVFSLVAWLVLIVTRHGHLCTTKLKKGDSIWNDLGYNGIPTGVDNAQINYDGYSFREGFALMVTGWAINVIGSALNTFL